MSDHQFLRLDTGARPFPPRLLIEDAVRDVEAYIDETAPITAQRWLETMAEGESWKATLEGAEGDYMLNVYANGCDTDTALHYAKLWLYDVCDIDDPE